RVVARVPRRSCRARGVGLVAEVEPRRHDHRHAGTAARGQGREDELMPISRLNRVLASELERLDDAGVAKRHEQVVTAIVDADGAHGPRVLLEGEGDKPFLRMNSNGYLGMSRRPEVIAAEEEAVARLGAGPGAVRFISGTYAEHVALEAKLAAFHGREAAMIFSSAYATQLGVLVPLLTAESAVVSDELNHNCIINAIRLSRPKDKRMYKHLDYAALDAAL